MTESVQRRWLEYMPLDDLVPAARNVKDHDAEVIRKGIDAFGLIDLPCLDERTGRLVAGAGRRDDFLARRAAGDEPPDGTDEHGRWVIPVIRGWASRSDSEAYAAGVTLNQATIAGGFKTTELGVLARDLHADDEALVKVLGFDDDRLAKLLRPPPSPRDALTDPDEVPEDAPQLTETGDVWLLGRHRLLCGDATKREPYRRLLLDELPALLITDPPYGVSYSSAGSKKRAILGDLSQAAIPVGLACSLDHLDDDGRVVLFGGSDQFAMYLSLFDYHLRQQPRVLVWAKEGFVLRHHGFHSQFELAYYGWKGTGGNVWHGERTVSDLWTVPRKKETGHETEKPVALFEIPIGHLVGPGDLVLDPFAGSGVTIIAAERLGRTARAIEKDPHWCDMICRRWQRTFDAKPVAEATGEPVDFDQ